MQVTSVATEKARSTPSDMRADPRALIGASALVMTGGKATEHVTYDLSAGGVRLCGLPVAQVGEQVRVLLQLPRGRGRVRAEGRLLRLGTTDGCPDFAIQFVHLAARAEDAIHNAVADALSRSNRRSILLLKGRDQPHWSGWDWLGPMMPICTTATTLPGAAECLGREAVEIGILSPEDRRAPTSDWIESYPKISWRSIDSAGRLHPPRGIVPHPQRCSGW